MCSQRAQSDEVGEFLSRLPAETRSALEDLRRTIGAAAPEATEAIGYGAPAFKYRGHPLVSFGAGKNHGAFYVQSPAVMDAHAQELKAYDTSKGTVRFTPDRPMPASLVTKLVKARVAETEGAGQRPRVR
jgi:uncharacterized protein YdhG (YjbR/CyaY superfamily)